MRESGGRDEMATRWRSRTRLVDEVAEELRARIYSGIYEPGGKLRQEQIAAELEISRTPLREAFRVLEREGLVTVTSSSGTVSVVLPDPEMLLAAYELREVIDGLAARLAAQNHPGDLGEELDRTLSDQREVLRDWDPAEWIPTNVAFHIAIMNACDNRYLLRETSVVEITSRVFTPLSVLEKDRVESAFEEHRGIAEAIVAREPEEAEHRARAHIRSTIDALHAALRAGMFPGSQRSREQARSG